MSGRTKNDLRPPRAAAWLVRRMFPDRGECSILGDMTETFCSLADDRGLFAARLWFWGQCVRAFPPFVNDELSWRLSMLKNYLVIFFRNMKRQKAFNLINFTGMTAGLTSFLLILLFVRFEFSFDRYHEHADSLYRIIVDTHEFYRGKDQVSVTPAGLAAALKEELPEVVSAVRVRDSGVLIRHRDELFSETVFYADPGILEMFTFPLTLGDAKAAMKDPYSLLLTRESARKYFGGRNPVGQTLSIDNRQYHVTGVLENIPQNSHFRLDFLSPFATFMDVQGRDRFRPWANWSYYTYVQLKENADPAAIEPKLTPLLRRHSEKSKQTLRLQPLKDIHFYGKTNFDLEPNTDVRTVYLFSVIALFILIIACFNSINLSTARASRRAKEVGMRKVVGATRKSLVRQFLAESFLFTLITLLLSIGLVKLLLPAFRALLDKELEFSLMVRGGTPLLLLGVLLFVGMASGLYPALVLSSFRAVSILKGHHKRTARGAFSFRGSLVALQFVVSVALIFCSLVVFKQLRFIRNRDLGLVSDYTMSVPGGDNTDAMRREFGSYPGILDMTAASSAPINVTNASRGQWEGKTDEQQLIVYRLEADDHFLDFFGLKLLAGRNFSPDRTADREAFILNEAAVKTLGWNDPLERRFGFGRELGTVIGVVKDFHFAPLNLTILPLAISLHSRNPGTRLMLRVAPGDIPGTIAFVESTWKKFYPDRVFRYSFLDETLDRMYRTERRLGTMFACFTLLAILIAGLGLFGIASFTAQQRTKEIGIRKVLGASVSGISYLLTRNFLRLVVIANLVALPAGWFFMRKWLQNFAYRTTIGPLVFAAAIFLSLGVALLTVGSQTVRAATADPVDSLRYE